MFLRLFEKKELEEAYDGCFVSGCITNGSSKRHGVVRLGEEVENLEEYRDKNTEYRKFIKCNLYLSDTEEDAHNKRYQSEIEGCHTIRIFY